MYYAKEAMMTIIYLGETDGSQVTRIERKRRLRDAAQVASAFGIDLDQLDRIYEVHGDEMELFYERPELAAIRAAERAFDEASDRERVMREAISVVFQELRDQVTAIDETLTRREGWMLTGHGRALDAFDRAEATTDELWRETSALSKRIGVLLRLGHKLDEAERQRAGAEAVQGAAMRADGWQEVEPCRSE